VVNNADCFTASFIKIALFALCMEKERPLGLIHVITGNGKGKTTSAMGMAVRAHGRDLKVAIIQFFKRDTGERTTMEKLNIPYFQFQPVHPYFTNYSEQHLDDLKKKIKVFWEDAIEKTKQCDFLVIDEIGPAMHWKVLDESTVKEFLKNKQKEMEVILTGRDIPESIKDIADYHNEVQGIKHPYQKGILAKKGVEY
jgi:cob(I)alamin adenosyltransferase